MGRPGLSAAGVRDRGAVRVTTVHRIPDVVAELCRRVPLSRLTITQVLKRCDRLDQVSINPSSFVDGVATALREALHQQVADGIVYRPLAGGQWAASRFADRRQTVAPGAVDELVWILPGGFTVPTPLGDYHPHRALLRQDAEGSFVHLVRDTEGGPGLAPATGSRSAASPFPA